MCLVWVPVLCFHSVCSTQVSGVGPSPLFPLSLFNTIKCLVLVQLHKFPFVCFLFFIIFCLFLLLFWHRHMMSTTPLFPMQYFQHIYSKQVFHSSYSFSIQSATRHCGSGVGFKIPITTLKRNYREMRWRAYHPSKLLQHCFVQKCNWSKLINHNSFPMP